MGDKIKDVGSLTYWTMEIQKRMMEGRKKIKDSGSENWYYIGEIDRMENELMNAVETIPDAMIDFGLSIMEMEVESLVGEKVGVELDGKMLYLSEENGIDDVVKEINDKIINKKY